MNKLESILSKFAANLALEGGRALTVGRGQGPACTLRRALGTLAALAVMVSWAAFGADPAKPTTPAAGGSVEARRDSVATNDLPKVAATNSADTQGPSLLMSGRKEAALSGGIDPHGDSWQSIQNSFHQFGQPGFMLRLFLSLILAVGCAWVIAWDPRHSKRADFLAIAEERKAFIILGVAGAIVAELSGTSPTLAFVIFGIGALLRFRTVLDNPKATGKAILAVVIGLACGMGSWTMAVFVTIFSWTLLFWLDSKVICKMTIRLDGTTDPKRLQTLVRSALTSRRCRLQSCTVSKSKKRLEFLLQVPATLDRAELEEEVTEKLPKTGERRVALEQV